MIALEHFIYALFPDGFKLLKSPNLNKTLNEKNLQFLYHIGDNTDSEVIMQTWFPNENVLAVSYIRLTEDAYKRKGVWNHTILISIDAFLQLTQPSQLLTKHFIKELQEVPTQLEPIRMEVKT